MGASPDILTSIPTSAPVASDPRPVNVDAAEQGDQDSEESLYLIGRPPLKSFLKFVRNHAVKPLGEATLTDAWQVTLGYWGQKRISHVRLYRRWDSFRSVILKFMSSFDLVLTPVAPDIAPLYRAKVVSDHQFSYTVPYSLTGNPCVVVRAGTSAENLPIGVQIVARNWQDTTALRAARAIERALGGWRPASVVG